MKLQIDVVSTEMVTPSSPTSFHLKNYKLSFLDQILPSLLMPVVLFYPPNDHGKQISNSERSNHLKKSLSKALTLFYPLAGRLVGNSYVNCSDEGVTYVEARVDRKLFDVITDPLIAGELNKFVPCDPDSGGDLCLVVQATFFGCGGLAIGIGISHKLIDGFSYFMFVNSWASFSRGDSRVESPILESAILFPPNDLVSEVVADFEKKEKTVTKMFVFGSRKIADLIDKYTKNTKGIEGSIRPTRVETLTTFIGTRFMRIAAASGKDHHTRNFYGIRIAVDIRTRVVPPLSKYHFGNMAVAPAITLPPLEKKDEDNGYGTGIVKKVRDAIHDIRGDYLHLIKNQLEKELENAKQVMCWFSSLCGFPLNKADFGWGMPVWIGVGNFPLKNFVYFTNSLSGGGIDALVTMTEEDMARFEADDELLKYVSCRDDAKISSKI